MPVLFKSSVWQFASWNIYCNGEEKKYAPEWNNNSSAGNLVGLLFPWFSRNRKKKMQTEPEL